MKVHRAGDWWVVAKITGPTSLFLGLRFGSEAFELDERWVVEEADRRTTGEFVIQCVTSALSARDSDAPRVSGVRFARDDWPDADTFVELTNVLVDSYCESEGTSGIFGT